MKVGHRRKFDKLIHNWRRLTGDVICTLWIFYNKLKVQGRRTDLIRNQIKLPTWLECLESKGISHLRCQNKPAGYESAPFQIFEGAILRKENSK